MSALALSYGRRDWIIELLLLLAEGVLIWMVAALAFSPFSSHTDPVDPLLAIGLVVVAGVVPRLLYDRGIWGASFSIVVAFSIAVSTLVTIKLIAFPGLPWFNSVWLREAARSLVFEQSGADIAVWAPVGLSAIVWWLAHFNGPPGLDRCRATLRTGALVTAFAAIASTVVETGPGDHAISLAIVIFFAATLIALAIARQGNDATQSRRRLLTTVLLPATAIVILASFFALVSTFDSIRDVPHSVSFLGTVLDPVFKLLLLIFTGIVIIVSLPILWLLSLGNFDPPQITQFNSGAQQDATRSAIGWQPPDPVRYLLAAIFLVVIFYGVARFGLALNQRDLERQETGMRAFGSGKGFGSWFDRFRGRFGRSTSDPLANLRNDPVWANTIRVRETYASWLRWAQTRNIGRDAGETAIELDSRAGPRLQSSSALDELTTIYDDVRYGASPATEDQANRAASAWQKLKTSESNQPKH